MLRIYECIAYQHDPWLVALAALVCLIGTFTSIDLLNHVRSSAGPARRRWLVATAVAAGSTVWSTHFIAMLAFLPGGNVGYEVAPTALSWMVAVGVIGLGFGLAVARGAPAARLAGGACVGLGVASMHYLGMSGLRLQGEVGWDTGLVIVSLLVAVVLGALSLRLALAETVGWRRPAAVACLTAAICGLHFVGMSAVQLSPDPTFVVATGVLSPATLAGMTAGVCVTLVALCIAGLVVDRRAQRQAAAEVIHMRDLADAAIEGLIVCDGEVVVAANRSFIAMTEMEPATVVGTRLDRFLPDRLSVERILAGAHEAIETEVETLSGARAQVELVSRPITFAGRPHRAVALRDLRDRVRADAEIRFLAHHDALTGLPNRASFDIGLRQRLADQREAQRTLAVLYLDLDRFKAVNDTLGHPIGDALLRLVADRLRSTLREDDVAARLGGDEFAVIQVATDQPRAVTALADRLIDLLARPYVIQGHMVNIGVSAGIALSPGDGTDAEQLMRSADLALYRAKDEGRGVHRFFEPGMDTRIRARRALEVDLRRAVARSEFEVHYQPQLGLRENGVIGVEALLRWRHPERGLVPPADFIPLAEETGLIVAIGAWVLRSACAEAGSWHHAIGVAVNLSPAQFRDPALFDTIRDAVEHASLDPSRLELEITEGVLLQDSAASLAVLHRLRSLGIRISMDDFGTGYSSLSYLRSFPFDKIKIDRSFVGDMTVNSECAAIVRTIIALGHSMGIATTAEGVETMAQLEQLRREGCDEVQGYLIGRPVPAADLEGLLIRPRRVAA